ncbi:hypothetical protein [Streptomyces spiralis]
MERQQILGLYQWSVGVCFRHPEKGAVLTTVISVIQPRVGGKEDVRACEECVIVLEQDRWVEARREGVAYRPGHAGEALY